MARLPVIGADADNWGALLNEFLRIAHHEDGTLRGGCPVINVHDFGAKGDGETNPLADDTAALQAAFAAVPPEGAVVCVPPGVYMVNKQLALKSKTHLKGAGASSLFKRITTDTQIIFFSESVSDVTVEAIGVDLNGAGQGTETNFATGIGFRTGCSHLRIHDCCVFDSTGTTVMGRMGILVLESDHVWIESNYLRDGLRLKAGGVGDRLIIENNFVENPNDNGIAIAVHAAQAHTINYMIRGNTVKAARGAFIYVGDDGFGVLEPPPPNVKESGIVYQNILIDGNLLLGPVQAGQAMIMVTLANVTERIHIVNNILNNVDALPGAIAGIETAIQTPFGRRGADFLIANNTVAGDFNQGAGIWVRSADRVRIVHNQVSNGTNYGIQIGTVFDQTSGGVDTAIVQGNIISDYARGLRVEDSTHIQVIGNSFRGLTFEGILLQTSAADQHVSAYLLGNQVVDNGDIGIKETGLGRFSTHYLFNDLRNNDGGAFAGINSSATRVGNLGATDAIRQHITGSVAWDPPPIAQGATQSTTVSVIGAQVGATVAVGFTQPLPAGALLAGAVTATNQVTVTLVNLTGSTFDLAQGILSVQVWRI